jgi:3-polyprenyl-4-hydroxybenzoate decarboxylase
MALADATDAAAGIHMLLTLRRLNVEIRLIISQEHGNALTRDASALRVQEVASNRVKSRLSVSE